MEKAAPAALHKKVMSLNMKKSNFFLERYAALDHPSHRLPCPHSHSPATSAQFASVS